MFRVLAVCLFFVPVLCGQQYVIFTIAGGVPPVNPAPAASSSVGDPPRAAVDSAGNLYFGSDHSIFKVDASGTLTCIGGTGREGFTGDGGAATSAEMSYPWGIAVDAAGNLYFTDKNSNYIRRIAVNGTIGVFAGSAAAGFAGDGGPASSAQFSGPSGLAFDSAGNLYVADTGNQRIRKIAPGGTISTVAGNGIQGYSNDGAAAINADLNGPEGVAADPAGNLYIADTQNQRIRMVAKSGLISTFAGTGFPGYSGDGGPATAATMFLPTDVAADQTGKVYIADLGSARIRVVANGTISSIAGNDNGTTPTDGQAAISARLNGPTGVTVDSAGNVYFAEGSIGSGTGLGDPAYKIFKVDAGDILTTAAGDGLESYSGDGGPAGRAQINTPAAMAFDSAGNLYVADSANNRVRQISPGGTIVTVAGTGVAGYSGDYGLATSAQLNQPMGVALDSAGNLYIADTGNNRIRLVYPDGIIAPVAGNGNAAFEGDGGRAVQAALHAPRGVAVDSGFNVYIADTLSLRVREITPDGIITTLAGSGVAGFSNDGQAATSANLNFPSSVAVDAQGNVYFTDELNGRVRMISTQGTITTVAGGGTSGPGDGGPAAQALLVAPKSVLLDGAGNLYITDSGENRVRMVNAARTITTIAGNGTCCYSGDGGLANAAQLNVPWGLALNAAGNLYVADSANNAIRQVAPEPSSSFILQVVSGASGQSGGISPGEIVTVYGAGLGPAQPLQYQVNGSGLIPIQLGGTQVLFNGTPGPVLYTSAGQVSVVAPYEISGANVQITVQYQGQNTPAVTVPLVASAPGIFSLDASGSGQARTFNADGTPNSATNPAAAGSAISFYATGEGQTSPVGVDGQLDGANPPRPVLPVSVTIGGQAAGVQYAGGVDGEVAGLMMVRVQIPGGVTPGSAVPIQLQVGSAASPATVTIAVGQ
jgi:uncharacterized protein (TIGR03437 family)